MRRVTTGSGSRVHIKHGALYLREVDRDESETTRQNDVPSGERQELVDRYANSVNVGVGLYDFTLRLGTVDSPGETLPHTIVRMSPQHAKSLMYLLEKFVGIYEREFGAISMPEDFVRQLRGENADDSSGREDERATKPS